MSSLGGFFQMKRACPSADHPENEAIQRIAGNLQLEFGEAPSTMVVLGSGLGAVVDRMTINREASTESLGLPQSTVKGHAGKVICGQLGRTRLLVLSGRVHGYEGHPSAVLVRYVRAAWLWGVDHLVLTCSAGGITEGLNPGHLVLISDHINFMNDTPLRGPCWGGTRFPDMSFAYSPRLRGLVSDSAQSIEVKLLTGVYAAMNGPAYETPAEIRLLATVGADMVGMSTVPEVLAANEVGLEVMAIAAISNRAAGLSDEPLSHDDVQVVAGVASNHLADLLACSVPLF
jgi:purine-nucleoside phosphorylase